MSAPFFPDLSAFSAPPPLWLPLAAIAGVFLDRLLGEVSRWHPLVGFGRLAAAVERALNRGSLKKAGGLLAWALVVLPFAALARWGERHDIYGWLLDVVLLYLALGGRSLAEHAERVASDLAAGDLPAAREHVGWIVSRHTTDLDESGSVLFRLANTLDAMWGYKTERFLRFGWAAALIDDLLNFVPARLTALSYVVFGGSLAATRRALACWRRQAPVWESPNAGPVMSAGAGSLGLALGGAAYYHGQLEERPVRGEDIRRALSLLRRGTALWLALFFLGGLVGA